MANIKFSQFTVETAKADVDFLVGYSGPDNVQISPTNLLADYPTGSGATGQVAFFNSTSSITGDSDLYWDSTNERLGIGTASPGHKFTIKAVSSSQFEIINSINNKSWRPVVNGNDFYITETGIGNPFVVQAGGNVGIGTTSPSAKLEVDGTLIATGISQLGSGGSNVLLTSSSAGNVGIGTTSPSEKLEVNGNILVNKGTTNRTAYVSDDGLYISRTTVANSYTSSIVADSSSSGNNLNIKARSRIDLILNGNTTLVANDLGKVGIGTDSPSAKLNVISADETVARFERNSGSGFAAIDIKDSVGTTGNSAIRFSDTTSTSGEINYEHADDSLRISTSSSERMRITSVGNVGIGTTSPTKKLDVRGDVIIAADTPVSPIGVTGLEVYNNAGQAQLMIHQDDGNQESVLHMRCGGNDTKIKTGPNTWALKIDTETITDAIALMSTSGNLGIGTTSPAYKLDVAGVIQGTGSIRVDAGSPYFGLYNSGTEKAYLQWSQANSLLTLQSDGDIEIKPGANNVGIGTDSPASKLEVDGGDIEVDDSASGLILRSPDGTRYRVTVANGGTLSVSAV